MTEREPWWRAAACSGTTDPDRPGGPLDWFSEDHEMEARCVAVCDVCAVKVECASEYGAAERRPDVVAGTAGGRTARERRTAIRMAYPSRGGGS